MMVGRLGGVLEALDRVWGEELVEVNAELGRVGLDAIVRGRMEVSDGVGE